MKVKVAELGNATQDLTFEKESVTIQDVLTAANIVIRERKKEKDVVLLNGEEVTDFKTRVSEGAIVTKIPKVKGGLR